MDTRNTILQAARQLTLERGVIPSLDAVAGEARISKGGLIHHFRNRAALVEGLAHEALAEVGARMEEAAKEGRAAQTWLRLSVPDPDKAVLYRAMSVAFRAFEAGGQGVMEEAGRAISHWQDLLAAETGDETRALMIRLVGDGLLMNALSGTPTGNIDLLLDALRPAAPDSPS